MFKTKQDLIDSLTTNDYLTIGNIEADWKHIHADCEKLAEENTSHWRPDMGERFSDLPRNLKNIGIVLVNMA